MLTHLINHMQRMSTDYVYHREHGYYEDRDRDLAERRARFTPPETTSERIARLQRRMADELQLRLDWLAQASRSGSHVIPAPWWEASDQLLHDLAVEIRDLIRPAAEKKGGTE